MSDNQTFGFGKFVPGFEFLQNIAKGSAQALPQMPSLSNWIAPTLNVEDLQKRIDELKAVHFWLDQNSKALAATVQALELQKMTLATLKGMNFNMAEVANALKLKTDGVVAAPQEAGKATAAPAAHEPPPADNSPRSRKGSKPADTSGDTDAGNATKGVSKAGSGIVDPLQWWGALTQQFQEIAAGAMKESGGQAAVEAARNLSAGATQAAMKMAGGMRQAASPPAKAPARKTGAKPARKGTRGGS